MKTRLHTATAIALAGILYLSFWPLAADPTAWDPPEDQGYRGDYRINAKLAGIRTIGLCTGPEDVDMDSQGRIYGSCQDGSIRRVRADGTEPEIYARTGGRPLGMDFDREGRLVVADARKGLLRIGKDGAVETLGTETGGIPYKLADDLAVAADGSIYFSDASHRFGLEDHTADLIVHGGYGRLLRYDAETAETEMLLDGLQFANGVAVSEKGDFVLVTETGAYRVLKHWTAGPRKGTSEPILENLPGFPDGISTGTDGVFWLALAAPRKPIVDSLAGWPMLRGAVLRAPRFLLPRPGRHACVLGIDGNGRILHNLQDPSMRSFSPVTSVEQAGDTLLLGSLSMPGIGIAQRP
jgi:hypothetical protein